MISFEERTYLENNEVWKNLGEVQSLQHHLPDIALYEISTMGRFRKLVDKGFNPITTILSPSLNDKRNRYVCRFSLNGSRCNIVLNKLVLMSFDQRPDFNEFEVYSINNNYLDARLINLMWSDGTRLRLKILTLPPIYNLPSLPGESWRHLSNNEFRTNWYISNFGRVFSAPLSGKKYGILTPSLLSTGYHAIKTTNQDNSKSITYLIHRLTLQAFKPINNPQDYQVNHIDGNKLNNHIDNLEWATPKENTQHAYNMNLKPMYSYPIEIIYAILDYYLLGLHSVDITDQIYKNFNIKIGTDIVNDLGSVNTRLTDIVTYMCLRGYTCINLFTYDQFKEILSTCNQYPDLKSVLTCLTWIKSRTPQNLAVKLLYRIKSKLIPENIVIKFVGEYQLG